MKKLAIVTSHPIQYNAPWFRLLAARKKVQVKVYYTWSQSSGGGQYDPDFGKHIAWDIPLLDGYDHVFIANTSIKPSSDHFKGLINPGLNKAIADWAPNAVLVIRWSFQSHLSCMRYFHKRVPILTRGDSTLLDLQPGWRKIMRGIVLRYIYNLVDCALYVGKHSKDYFKAYGLKEAELILAPHAVDNDRFAETAITIEAGRQWRKQLSISADDLVFLFAGKLEPKKNPALLLQAFIALDAPGVHLVMVGNGVQEVVLKNQYAQHKGIHFVDFKNQSAMPGIYNLCDVFVLPSQGPEETWGLALNEAMANKRAVIASNKCGGTIDLIIDGENGYIFESGNMAALVEKMKAMIDNKDQIAKMGNRSHQIIQQFSFENICVAIEDVMEKKIK